VKSIKQFFFICKLKIVICKYAIFTAQTLKLLGCLRAAALHLVAWSGFVHQIDWSSCPRLLASFSQIWCAAKPPEGDLERFFRIQKAQHSAALRRTTTLPEWIHALLSLKEKGGDPTDFITKWNQDCKTRGAADGLVGGKAQAVNLWLKHPAPMARVSAPQILTSEERFLDDNNSNQI
jgi:hypothetical protein